MLNSTSRVRNEVKARLMRVRRFSISSIIKVKQRVKCKISCKIMFPAGRGTKIFDFEGEENRITTKDKVPKIFILVIYLHKSSHMCEMLRM